LYIYLADWRSLAHRPYQNNFLQALSLIANPSSTFQITSQITTMDDPSIQETPFVKQLAANGESQSINFHLLY
jgi:hypothetical protein